MLTVGAAQTAIHLWIQDQTKGTELAVKRFRKNIENLEKPEDKYELCREMERLCVLRSEVNEVQVAIVLEEVKKVDDLEKWSKKDGDLWTSVKKIADRPYDTTKVTKDDWSTVEKACSREIVLRLIEI